MKALLWIVLAATAVLAALNWPAFNTPQPLWLGFTTVTAPLGVVLLGALALIALLMLIEQSIALTQARRHARELDAQRRMVDKAEGSRLTELRAWLTEEMARSDQRAADAHAALINRLETLERDLRSTFDQLARRALPAVEIREPVVPRDGPPPVIRR
jgi:uncharacterized integral membrane protein